MITSVQPGFRRRALLLCMLAVSIAGATSLAEAAPTRYELEPHMRQVWERTDRPVASGEAARSWIWGPSPFALVLEPYNNGQRAVAYYDKGRMEITDPKADPNGQWYVTSGLLVRDMISGVRQTGDTSGVHLGPSSVPVAGDVGFGNFAPSYASLSNVASLRPGANRAPNRMGKLVVATINQQGSVGQDPKYTAANVVNRFYEPTLGHNIPNVFWDFLNRRGTVYQHGRKVEGPIVDWRYVAGHPITEPYWAKVRFGVDKQEAKDVLIQAFERRILTYTPDNDPAWRVEMGNTGKHYYIWVYEYPYR